jgi:hypothetical protein
MIREVRQSGPFTLTFALNGLGELKLDDIRVVPLDSGTDSDPLQSPPESADGGNKRSRALEFFNRLPKLNPLARRNKPE